MATADGPRLALARLRVLALLTSPPRLFERLYRASFYGEMHERWMAHLGPQPGQRILDVGCGPGGLAAALAQRGCDVVGIDRSSTMVAAARTRASPQLRLSFAVAEAEALPVADRWADLVLASSLLNVVGRPAEVLRELTRCVARDGRVSALLPGPDFTFQAASRYLEEEALGVEEGALLQVWTRAPKVAPGQARAWFREAGLKDVSTRFLLARFAFAVTGRPGDHVPGLRQA